MDLEQRRQKIRLLLSKNSSYNSCFAEITMYRNYAMIAKDKNHMAYADFYESKIQQNNGNLVKAIQLIKKHIPFYKKTNNKVFLQASYLAMGTYKNNLNKMEEAIHYFNKALKMESSLKQNKAIALNNISIILVNLKQYDTAIQKINAGLKEITLKDKNDRPLYFGMLLNLASIFLSTKKMDKALEILQKIEKAQKKYPQDRIYGILNRNYGNYYRQLKNYDLAISYYDKAIDHLNKNNSRLELLKLVVAKAETLLEINEISEAENLLLQEYKVYNNENAEAYNEILCLLIEIYTINGNTSERKKYQEELDIITSNS